MFETMQTITTADGKPDVMGMVSKAMEYGLPAADHRAWGAIFEDICKRLRTQFESGHEWLEFDWRYLNGTAAGIMSFHSDGTLYGCYSFNGFAR